MAANRPNEIYGWQNLPGRTTAVQRKSRGVKRNSRQSSDPPSRWPHADPGSTAGQADARSFVCSPFTSSPFHRLWCYPQPFLALNRTAQQPLLASSRGITDFHCSSWLECSQGLECPAAPSSRKRAATAFITETHALSTLSVLKEGIVLGSEVCSLTKSNVTVCYPLQRLLSPSTTLWAGRWCSSTKLRGTFAHSDPSTSS